MACEPRTTLYCGQNAVARLSTYKRHGLLVSAVTVAQRCDLDGSCPFELHGVFRSGIFGLNALVSCIPCKVATQRALDQAHVDALVEAGRLVARRLSDLRSPPPEAQLRPAVPYDPAAPEDVHPAVLRGVEELSGGELTVGGAP